MRNIGIKVALSRGIMSNTHSSESKNPRDGASWLSIIFFWWMNDLLRLGSNQPLTEGDLFPLLEGYKAEALVKKAEKCWLDELRRSKAENKKPRLLRLGTALSGKKIRPVGRIVKSWSGHVCKISQSNSRI